MIEQTKLIAIREGFRANFRGFTTEVYHLDAKVSSVEIDPYTSAIGCLVALVHEHVAEGVEAAKKWLIEVVFANAKRTVFLTAKDVYIHVMTALDTAIAVLATA